jgi:tRNA(fMet)-specific endonuclease VapC
MTYLLDTNVCIELLRGRNAAVTQRLAATSASDVRLCAVVKAELYHGAHRSQQSQTNLTKVEDFARRFISLPFDDDAARVYGLLRADLESRGIAIGPNDLQIASIALAHGLTVVTHNTREFSKVAGLTLEDWQSTP